MISNSSQSHAISTVPVIAQLAIECLTEDRGDGRRQRRTCCDCVESVGRWIPVILIGAIIVYSYYVYVWHLCLQNMTDYSYVVLGVVLLWYHLLLLLFLWAYARSIWAKVMPIPDAWSIPDTDWARLTVAKSLDEKKRILSYVARRLPVGMCDQNGLVRYCIHCRIIKPDRAHHCRTCERCILKMDHHCPWVNNCVHFHNYKFFLQFLFYSVLYCLNILVTLLYVLQHAWGFDFNHLEASLLLTMIPMVFAMIFTLAALVMLVYHMYLVLVNRTTMEAVHSPIFCVFGSTRKSFHLGRCTNLCEVFGDRWYLWPFPIYSSRGSGLTFPIHIHDDDTTTVSSADA